MARKGENIYKRKDGRWEGRYGAGRLPDGRARYRSVYGKTYREVKEKLLIKKRDACLAGGKENMLPQGLTIRESVCLWMEENQTKWKESTLATYRSIAEKHILPVIGRQAVSGFDEEAWRAYFEGLRGQACAGKKAVRNLSSSDFHPAQPDFSFHGEKIPLQQTGAALGYLPG